ncbi:RNA polymerase sigma factor CnrH [Thalassoglobus neptunius]|uniref:RNA polymerase sigma factor CnrH n=1 Tax=Thalassoglobus neptunius TaxID=1938619 RepID=A0A5C5WIH3_9PLAN|nr:sigma-70 family RNA polymerase sigma factor [Thalassoglobus neptunius]TWT49823.1 RNA polymerase sigma factor CnrH [Thalassoglobus neptunius]
MPTTRRSLLLQIRDLSNSDKWTEFVKIYRPLIADMCRRHGVQNAGIDDVVQDVMIQIMHSIGRFERDESKGRFRSWLKCVVVNKIRDRWRSGKVRRATSLQEACAAVEAQEAGDDLRVEQRSMMHRAIAQVKEASLSKTWKCFDLHCLQKMPAADVAIELGLSENAVYANCSRTLTRIRTRCQELKRRLAGEESVVFE